MMKKTLFLACILASLTLLSAAKKPQKAGPIRMPIAEAINEGSEGFSLLTCGTDQFVAFFASDQSLTVGQRKTNTTQWKFVTLSAKIGNDGHNSVTMAVDKEKRLHVAGNEHTSSPFCFQSAKPLDIKSLEPIESFADEEIPGIQDSGRYRLEWQSSTLYLVDTKPYSAMLESFPSGADPVVIGNRVGNRLLETEHQLYGNRGIHYAEVCTWYGALRFAKATGNEELLDKLRARFDYLTEQEKELLPPPIHVDQNMFGCLPLRLYALTGQKSYLDMGLMYADTQWTLPEGASAEEKAFQDKDYTWQTRLWIDDMFMITIVQKEAYLRTGERRYLDRAAREMVMYLDELQRDNGLFYHAPDVPYCWSRGDGWMAVGMADLLELLPEGDGNRAAIMKGYLKMMEGLRANINGDGIWNQVIDEKDFWPESSGSAMFTYAMIRGVKNGWLDEATYAPIVRRAWLSLCNYVNPNGDVDEVCVGTGKRNSRQYYYNRPRVSGDYHGQAPVIWCALALLSSDK